MSDNEQVNEKVLNEMAEAIHAVRSVSTDLTCPYSFKQALIAYQFGMQLMQWAAEWAEREGDLPEIVCDRVDRPAVLGQMIMTQLDDPDSFTAKEKAFWTYVSEHIGPDWIAKLKRVAAFMDKVEAF
jgi:hypothetical protein